MNCESPGAFPGGLGKDGTLFHLSLQGLAVAGPLEHPCTPVFEPSPPSEWHRGRQPAEHTVPHRPDTGFILSQETARLVAVREPRSCWYSTPAHRGEGWAGGRKGVAVHRPA